MYSTGGEGKQKEIAEFTCHQDDSITTTRQKPKTKRKEKPTKIKVKPKFCSEQENFCSAK